MGRLLDIVTPLHKATKRDYLARMNDDKVHCMVKAKEYEFDYWDGDRRYGYGGYKFIDGRWKPVAQALIDIYGLKDGSSVLDVGCGKAFLLYEMKKILPGLKIAGFDQVREIAFRPWAANTIPRRFCSAIVHISDGSKHELHYSIGEDTGMIGSTWGVEWCVVGLDRNWAYNPACTMAEP